MSAAVAVHIEMTYAAVHAVYMYICKVLSVCIYIYACPAMGHTDLHRGVGCSRQGLSWGHVQCMPALGRGGREGVDSTPQLDL